MKIYRFIYQPRGFLYRILPPRGTWRCARNIWFRREYPWVLYLTFVIFLSLKEIHSIFGLRFDSIFPPTIYYYAYYATLFPRARSNFLKERKKENNNIRGKNEISLCDLIYLSIYLSINDQNELWYKVTNFLTDQTFSPSRRKNLLVSSPSYKSYFYPVG